MAQTPSAAPAQEEWDEIAQEWRPSDGPNPAIAETTGVDPEEPAAAEATHNFIPTSDAVYFHWRGHDHPPHGDGTHEKPFRTRDNALYWAKRNKCRYVIERLDPQGKRPDAE